MHFDDVILGRRSIRGYKPDPVPRALIEDILTLAMRAPSSMNTQPWNFYIITGEPLDRIRKGNTANILAGVPDSREFRRGEAFALESGQMRQIFGPRWRMLVIGAGQLSRVLAQMALALDFEVIVCDPREEYHLTWDIPNTTFTREMPDDAVLSLQLDAHCAVVAVTHDPKLDDMVLLEALKSPCFYVGALGSRGNTAKRKERLKLFDLTDAQLDRLHGPIGLDIGSKTPAEIAVSIVAEIIAVQNGVALLQKKPALESISEGAVCASLTPKP
jgi:xanthine/CO dehydrogenase XdhC/CoxF family maturation factor